MRSTRYHVSWKNHESGDWEWAPPRFSWDCVLIVWLAPIANCLSHTKNILCIAIKINFKDWAHSSELSYIFLFHVIASMPYACLEQVIRCLILDTRVPRSDVDIRSIIWAWAPFAPNNTLQFQYHATCTFLEMAIISIKRHWVKQRGAFIFQMHSLTEVRAHLQSLSSKRRL
jgi:hypothetical protein